MPTDPVASTRGFQELLDNFFQKKDIMPSGEILKLHTNEPPVDPVTKTRKITDCHVCFINSLPPIGLDTSIIPHFIAYHGTSLP